jgi:hypothetical protein
LQDRHADVAPIREVFEDGWRRALVACFVEDDGRVDSEMYGRGVRPGDRADFKAGVGAGITIDFAAGVRGQYRQVARFVEQVAGVKEALFVDDQDSAVRTLP